MVDLQNWLQKYAFYIFFTNISVTYTILICYIFKIYYIFLAKRYTSISNNNAQTFAISPPYQ